MYLPQDRRVSLWYLSAETSLYVSHLFRKCYFPVLLWCTLEWFDAEINLKTLIVCVGARRRLLCVYGVRAAAYRWVGMRHRSAGHVPVEQVEHQGGAALPGHETHHGASGEDGNFEKANAASQSRCSSSRRGELFIHFHDIFFLW